MRAILHPEVSIPVTVNVARSPEEAEKQARGEAIGGNEDENEAEDEALEVFDPGAGEQP